MLATLQAGKGAAGVSINKAGTLALVANREEGTVSVFTISGTTVTAAGKVTVGGEKSGPSSVIFDPDGKSALVTRDDDHRITILSIDGNKVEVSKREIAAGLRPYGLDISSKGDVAVVANIGVGGGDADTISLIDLKLDPPRVVGTYTVGQTPGGDQDFARREIRRRQRHERLQQAGEFAILQWQWSVADLVAHRHAVDKDRRAADWPLVPGHRLVRQRQDPAGAVHG